MSFINATHNQVALHQIRDILKLPSTASHNDVVARVRELKAIEDLSLEVHRRAKSKSAGCAACDRGDYQLGHADTCPKAIAAGIMARGHWAPAADQDDDLPIGPRRDLTGTRDHRIP